MKALRHVARANFAIFILVGSQLAKAQNSPSITIQPQSQVADHGADVAFTVSATGTEPLTYQWYNGSSALADYDNVAGAQTPTLYLAGIGEQDAKYRRYYVVISNAAGSVTSAVATLAVNPKMALQDNFEKGLSQWSPLLDSIPIGISNSQNHTANGGFSAVITNSAQKMYHRLVPKETARVRMTMWIYDAGGAQTAFGELRGYTGESGYAKYIPPKGLRQCFAAGIYTVNFGTNNTGNLTGETLDPTKYQGRVMSGTNAGWFNLNTEGAPNRSPGWHEFQIDRSRTRTIVSFYVDGVLARRIHDVKVSPLDTVTIGSTGAGESNQGPAAPVNAWFDDVTVEGFDDNYEHQSLVAQGPIPELMQRRETGTNAAVVAVTPTTVCELNGAATNNGVGTWVVTNSEIQAQDIRGYLEYSVNAPADNAYRIEIEGREKNFKWPAVELKLGIWLDGERLGRVDLPYGQSSNGLAHCFTPFIRAGSHRLKVYWDNARPRCALVLHAIRLQTLSGGTSVQGMQTWVANRLLAQCGMDSPPDSSFVSPVCLEGRGAYLSMMSLAAGINDPLSTIKIHHGAGNRWYANVPLSPSDVTRVEASYQNGGLTETNEITWKVTNLLDATNAVIRKGDSLLLTAVPDGATSGAVTIQVSGQASVQTDVSTPVPYQFNAAGTYTVTGSYGPTGASGSITVTVIDASFNGPFPARVWFRPAWDCTNLPPGVVLDSDPRLTVWPISAAGRAKRLPNAPPLGVNGREFRIETYSPEPRYVVARLGTNGPILANTAILGYQFTTPPWSSFRQLSTQADGSQIIEATYVLSPLVAGVSMNLSVAAAGLTFGDGTLTKTLTKTDFNELGVCRLNVIRSAGVEGSACMVLDIHNDSEGTDGNE